MVIDLIFIIITWIFINLSYSRLILFSPVQYAKISIDISLTIATQYLFDLIAHYKYNFKASCLDLVQMGAYQTTFIVYL